MNALNAHTKRLQTVVVSWPDLVEAMIDCGIIVAEEKPKMCNIRVDYGKETISWELTFEEVH